MQLFLSYASEDKNLAEQIYFALTGASHDVFFDRTSLPAGGDYNSRIRQAIIDSDLFIFLISDDSVEESSYARTELSFAQTRWRHPGGFVLPVMVRKTNYDRIPNYLKAVTILEPTGNIAAAVSDEVIRIADNRKSNATKVIRSILFKNKHRVASALAASSILAVILFIALPKGIFIKAREESSDSVSIELKALTEKVQNMEANAVQLRAEYETLKQSLSLINAGTRDDLNTRLKTDLTSRFTGAVNDPFESKIDGILRDTALTDGVKNNLVIELISNLRLLDRDIESQARLINSQNSSPSIDIETMKLKRMIDKRGQMFDILRQIIDRYNQTAKGIIDSIGR